MLIVAVTRWGPGLDAQLPELAKILGLFPYDLRIRLNGPLPVVVLRTGDRDLAAQILTRLRAWGHGAVGCDEDKVLSSDAMHQPREFSFAGDLLVTEDPRHTRAEVASADVFALIHTMVVSDHRQTAEKSGKQFSAARAVLSGGLVMTRSTSSTAHVTESESEERVYLVRRDYSEPMLLAQHQLHYQGLGAALGRSSHENFASLVEQLRRFSPTAFYSTQLRDTRRKPGFAGASTSKTGTTTTTTVSNSNASDTDLAAHLIVVAHARGQL
jgi:hypothetical protein